MPWNANIPQPNDRINDSQNDLLENFTALQAWSIVNHSDIGAAAANLGQHTYLTLFPQANNPAGNLLGANNLNLWIDNANTAQLLQGNNIANAIPWLNRSLNSAPGFTYLPTGLVFAWTRTVLPLGDTNFNATAIVGFTTVYSVWVMPYSNGANVDTNRAYTVITLNNPAAITIKATLRDTAVADPGNDNALIFIIGVV